MYACSKGCKKCLCQKINRITIVIPWSEATTSSLSDERVRDSDQHINKRAVPVRMVNITRHSFKRSGNLARNEMKR